MSEVKPPAGYRWVNEGEVLLSTDEWVCRGDGWAGVDSIQPIRSEFVGKPADEYQVGHEDGNGYIRRIAKPPAVSTGESSVSSDTTNPKDLLGVKKVQIGLFPAAGLIYGARAMENGAAKYGPYNWRDKKVRMTVYLDAAERHLIALRDGEDEAPDSGISHLAHILACCAILADAKEGGFLIDDRPPKGPASAVLEKFKKE